ncbi:MAG: transketolase [Chitinivibrionales bacterium]|nr:transketolase [Chitinivibrionales bacterium]MBD3394091.1 transketolase [Chitinivibrionales bacterium]
MGSSVMDRAADNIRVLSAAMVEKAKSGHPGGPMGGADFINVLYSEFLRFDPDDFSWPFRDRFFLDAGHMSPMLYSALSLVGAYSLDDLKQFRQWGSPTPGHPELDVRRGVENTSGPLGQGHGMALGAAIAERFLAARFGEWMAHYTYVYISDGGIQEEISQSVGRLAGHLGLGRMIMFYDSNDIQLSHRTEVTTSEDTAKKYEAWGWHVQTIAGNDAGRIRAALKAALAETGKPSLIIGKTIMGKGARGPNGESFEGQVSTHGMPLSKAGASFENTVKALGGNPDDPFAVFDDVAAHYRKVVESKRSEASALKKQQDAWGRDHADLAATLASYLDGAVPAIDFASIKQKDGVATRSASGTVLAEFGAKIDNMIVMSADLSNSDNTNGYLKQTSVIQKGDFAGKFLQVGVSELTMAAIASGMALHGGVIPVCGTFFVFSDFMKPAVRLAALMGLGVKYVWTHDAFRVGEDGPTHQPVEQEAQIRLLEKMANLEGKRSMLVLRPADASETTVAWELALQNTHSPTALILSRQTIPRVCTGYDQATRARKGAYVLHDCDGAPDVVLVGNGSEVATLIEGAKLLESQKNLKVRVVSAISEALFLEQSDAYRESVLPFGVPAFGLTAGLSDALAGLVGPFGKAVGMTRFGASGPYKVLDEKFGYTAENVAAHVDAYLKEFSQMMERVTAVGA